MRTIRYSPLWEQCEAHIGPQAARLADVLRGVEWAVASDAENCGSKVPDSPLRVILTDPFPGAPALLCAYSIEDESYAVLEWFVLDPYPPPDSDDNPEGDG